MQIAAAGISLPFEYSAYDQVSTLSVAMRVYDVTTGSPSFVVTIGMTHVTNGTYVGFFTPLANKRYLINKMVYTDGTYAVTSQNYSPGSESIQVTTEQSDVSAILSDVGTIETGVTGISSDTTTLLSRLTSTRASNLDNLDATISSRASQASVDALQNNTTFVGIVPTSLIIPETGNTPYVFFANLFDDAGNPTNADANILNITITDSGGGIVVATTPMTNVGIGQYDFTYTVFSTDPERPLTVKFTYNYLSVAFVQYRVTQTTAFASSLDLLLSRLTATRANNLDNLDVTVSSRASAAAASAIQAIVSQLHFNGGNVLAETVINDDKSGYTLSPGFVQTLVNAIWDELLSSHVASGTMGANQNLLGGISTTTLSLRADYTTARAAKLDNLDAAISTRADFASVSAVGTAVGTVQTTVNGINTKLGIPATASVSSDIAAIKTELDGVNAKTSTLPSDPASESGIIAALTPIGGSVATILTDTVAIKAKTDNLPPDPASGSAIAGIPTNPLLTTDTRLNHLDANISSRTAPSDLAPLATAAGLSSAEAAILAQEAVTQGLIAPLATTAQLASAVAPLALQTTLLDVQSDVDAIIGTQLTAAQVWSYTPRGLTLPVTTTDDLSLLAKTTDVTTAEANIIAALPTFGCEMAASIDPSLDILTFQVWLEQNHSVVTDPQTAEINVFNSVGAPIIVGLMSSSPSAQGVFTLTYAHASAVFAANQAYTVTIDIVKGINDYETTKAMTVF